MQTNLKGQEAEKVLNKKVIPEKNARSDYSRFFSGAFADIDVNELIRAGAGDSLHNFKELSKNSMRSSYQKGYYEKMFDVQQKEYVLHYSRLSKAIYTNYFEGERPEDFRRVLVKYKTKTGFVQRERFIVLSKRKIEWGTKTYAGGQILPKAYIQEIRKGD